jgi:hypothetical protein
MAVSIHRIDIADSAVNFSDLSVKPNFSAGIQKLGGFVSGLSSQSGTRAKVDLKGEVDAFSPVSIAGEVNLLSPAMYTDITMSFRNIELSIINPYSGKFAGYDISKGKLSTEMHYKLDGRKLDAQHHITIDQLEFGEKTESKDAVSLPIKLAVALLKDRNGVIDLDLPVSGSIDDPTFRIWPIIGKVLVNILEKLVTAPFKLLGSLFSGGPDLQFVDFQPGSAALDAAASDRLKSIAKALTDRPQLKLDLPIAVVPAIDGPALADAKFQAQLAAAQKLKPGATPPPRLAQLHTLYLAMAGTEPRYPDTVAAARNKADADALKVTFLEQDLRQRIKVTDDELLNLGQQRALALQQALLTGTERRRHRLDADLHGAGADDDHPGPRTVLRRHGAQEKRARHSDAKLRRHLPGDRSCGGSSAIPGRSRPAAHSSVAPRAPCSTGWSIHDDHGNRLSVSHLATTIPETVSRHVPDDLCDHHPGADRRRLRRAHEILRHAGGSWGLWSLLVYCPGGPLGVGADRLAQCQKGVLDFAGGTVVHINAGVAGLASCLVLGKRLGYGRESMQPHNLTLTVMGASLLWVGWFGFNAGSAVAADGRAGMAMLATQIATAAAALAWMFAEWLRVGKPSCSASPPARWRGWWPSRRLPGFVGPSGAALIGSPRASCATSRLDQLKRALGYDDSLDAFGVHGIGGIVGALLTGASRARKSAVWTAR